MDAQTLLLITQLLGLAAQAAASIPAIRNAFGQSGASSTAEQEAEIAAHLKDAHANLQSVLAHVQTALNTPIAAPRPTAPVIQPVAQEGAAA